MLRRPPRSTRTDTLFPYTTLFRSHDKGLSGHSDADVVLHALTDALLGTIAAGDIGTHFPPSDPQWKGAASDQFLDHAAALIAERGGIVDFVDLTVMCEAPKIGPHRDTMRSEEHTSELQSLMRISYAVFCLKKKTNTMTDRT